jgi:Fe-S oxidoreductase
MPHDKGFAMDGPQDSAGFLDTFRARGAAIADACTRCGDCFRACPMTGPAGIADANPSATAGNIVDLITGGDGDDASIRWTEACSGSGYCIPACKHGINPRFMVQLARGFARRNVGDKPLQTRWRQGFQTMSRGVRVLSRLQIPPETLARFKPSGETRTGPPDVVFYTGCNVLKTPHIALLCLDILDLLGVDYEVMGGVGQCCGVYQYRSGDFVNNSKMAYATIDGLASAGASTVLSWCPSCQISIGEVSLPNYQQLFGE